MNKATPITIAGRVFYLEEPGYGMLQAYLASLRAFFGGHDGRDEIMADIESRIAERFSELVATSKEEAITPERITELMDVIGRPEDLHAESSVDASTAAQPRKLYRDTSRGMVAGVCSGLGAYFDIDPNLIRVAFFVATLAAGIGPAAYIILWIVVPAAQSSSDRLRMQGAPVTLASLARLFPESVRNPQTRREELNRIVGPSVHYTKRGIGAVLQTTESVFVVVSSLLRKVLGLAFIAFGGFGVLAVCFFVALGISWFPTGFLDTTYVAFLETIPVTALVLFTGIAALIPSAFILAAGVALLKRRAVIQPTLGFGLMAVWFVAIITAGVLATKTGMQWQAFEQTYQGYQRTSITLTPAQLASVEVRASGSVRVVDGPSTSVTITGRKKEMDRVTTDLKNGALVVTEHPDSNRCVMCDKRWISITIASPNPDSIRFYSEVEREYDAFYVRQRAEEAAALEAARAARETRDPPRSRRGGGITY
jgi:phage shock protein PspC (stress-responsive transcriptional regulator)